MSQKAEAIMTFKKDVKHSVVFENPAVGAIMSSVYVSRLGLAKAGISEKAQKIKVTVEAVE